MQWRYNIRMEKSNSKNVFYFVAPEMSGLLSDKILEQIQYTHWTIKTWHFIYDYNFG